MRWAAILPVTLALASCGNNSYKVQATSQGVFYTDWFGHIYQITDGKISKLEVTTKVNDTLRSLPISETIPDVSDQGFPAVVSGTMKVGNGFHRIKLTLFLGPDGKRLPTTTQQEAFVYEIVHGSGKLKALFLSYMDSDGFLASDDKTIGVPGPQWIRTTDNAGISRSLSYSARESSNSAEDREINNIEVRWSSADHPIQALPDMPAPEADTTSPIPPSTPTPPS